MSFMIHLTLILYSTAPLNVSSELNIESIINALRENDFSKAAIMLQEYPNPVTVEEQKQFETFLKQHSPQGNWIPFLIALADKLDANPDFLFFLSQAMWRSGDIDGAIDISSKAMEAAPKDADLIYKCAAIARTLNKIEIAKRRIETVLVIDKSHPDALFLLGSIYAEEGKNKQAKLTLQSVLATHPKHLRSLFELGKLETRLGNDKEAVAHLEKAVEVYPFFREAYSAMRTPLSRLGKKDEFEKVQQRLLHMRKWNPDQYKQLRYLYENAYNLSEQMRTVLAQELIALQNYDRAKQYLSNLYQANQINDHLKMLLAQIHYNQKEFDDCLKILNDIDDDSIKNSENYIGIKGWSLLGIGEISKSQDIYHQHKDQFEDSPNFKALGEALTNVDNDVSHKTSSNRASVKDGFQFVEISKQTGLDAFEHRMGHKDKRWIIDAMGSGVAVADYDNDGDDDIYFVNGRPALDEPDPKWCNRLFRNDDGQFVDVTETSGTGDRGWGMCAIFGDVNNDGWLDLFVGNYGHNTFYINQGDGTFSNQTDEAGLTHNGYAAAAVFGDLDLDGDLDLFVGNYVKFDPIQHGDLRDNYHGMDVMKGPMGLKHQHDLLYFNDGTGTFVERSEESGVNVSEGRAMGAALADLDLDGDLDLYVSNDSTYNHLLLNKGNGVFEDCSFFSGAAVNESGREGASMGVATGDYNNDGLMDIYVTAYEQESDVLFHNKDGRQFVDMRGPLKLTAPSRWLTTWGTGFCDFDSDGFLDIYTVNGHTYPQVEKLKNERTYPQGVSFYKNYNGKYFDVENVLFKSNDTLAGRGSALLDYDRDGDMDVVINCMDDSPRLLENKTSQGNWLQVKLIGTSAQTYGVRVVARSADRQWTRNVDGGSSYLSQNSPILHFGFGKIEKIDRITVYWLHQPPQTYKNIQLNQTFVIQY